MGSTLIDGLGLITWGIVLAGVGLALLGEYRKVFFQEPRAVITFEVWAQAFAEIGGPGYLACLFLFCSVFFLIGGVVTLLMVAALTMGLS